MPQITLSVPQEKLPLLQEFLQALGIEGQNMSNLSKMFRKPGRNTGRNNQTESKEPFSWEYYCNELEFE